MAANAAAWNRRAEPGNKPLTGCAKDENFIQNKFGYCFYTFDIPPIIYNLYVHPQYRCCGHSQELLKLVIAEIRKSGYKGKTCIQAAPKENSIRQIELEAYYKRMGLTIYDARKPEGNVKIKETP
jgi:GNAT superfamily N-acetyltransferase